MKAIMGMSGIQLAIAAIVVVAILAVGAIILTGNNGSVTYTTTAVSTVPGGSTTIAQTTVTGSNQQGNQAPTLQSLAGRNMSLSEVSADIEGSTFATATMLNATYDYKYTISITSPSSYTLNGTGTSKIQKYNNDSRIDMTTSVADRNVVSAIIYNSTANMGYVCTSTNGGIAFSCRTSAKVDIWGNAGGMGFLASQGGSENVTGYFSNIAVSDSSYNGIPCTLVTGDVYGKSNATSGNPGVVLKGRMGSCISSQYGTWITQFMTGTIQTSMSGYAVNATLNYSMNEVSIGTTTSAAITELPGPVVS